MDMYFKEFASYDDMMENSKTFIVRVKVKSVEKAEYVISSAIPNTPETMKAVLAAIATSTAPEYAEPFCVWAHRQMTVIPAASIESILIEFAPLSLDR